MNQRIVIVEDDPALAKTLSDALCSDGFDVHCVRNGALVATLPAPNAADLVLIDVLTPGSDAFNLRAVAGRGRVLVVALMLEPFDLEEALARVRVLMGRKPVFAERIRMGNVTIDFVLHRARRGDCDLRLTHREFQLMQFLASRPGQVVYREELLRQVWGYRDNPLTRSVDHAIARLRKKIETDVHHPRFIHSVRGDGYSLTPEGLPAMPAR